MVHCRLLSFWEEHWNDASNLMNVAKVRNKMHLMHVTKVCSSLRSVSPLTFLMQFCALVYMLHVAGFVLSVALIF